MSIESEFGKRYSRFDKVRDAISTVSILVGKMAWADTEDYQAEADEDLDYELRRIAEACDVPFEQLRSLVALLRQIYSENVGPKP